MRTLANCPICSENLRKQGLIPDTGHYDGSLEKVFFVEFGDDFVLKGSCTEGHLYVGCLQKERYDLLYESAIYSYLSGFELEAVLGFAASLERAQELFIWTSLRAQGIELELIKSYWKTVSSQSERQIGTFLSQWLFHTKSVFPFEQKMTEFRNKVVHKGYIPVREDARKYAAWVNERLFDIVEVLRQWQGEALKEIAFFDRENRVLKTNEYVKSKKNIGELKVVSVFPPYLTNLNHGDEIFKRESFEEVCKKARQTMKIHGLRIG